MMSPPCILGFLLLVIAALVGPVFSVSAAEFGKPGHTMAAASSLPWIGLWSQEPELDHGAFFKCPSQIDVVYPFDCGYADDFQSYFGYDIHRIRWWGGSFNSPTGPAEPDYFVITFYEHDGDCIPPDPQPGVPGFPTHYFYQEIVTEWEEVIIDSIADLRRYDALIGPVPQNGGQIYWVEIQAVLEFMDQGQWGWLKSRDPSWNCTAVHGWPLYGIPYWETDDDHPATSFELYADETISTERATWGSVKSMYR